MPVSIISATLVGSDNDYGAVQFGDFRRFCDDLTKCLGRVETKFAERPSKPLRYRIVDLSSGSACMTFEPIPRADGPDLGPEVVKLFSETVADIQNGRGVDPRFTNDDLKQFRSLVSGINRNLKQIRINNTKITSRFIADIDDILGSVIPTEGSVKGEMERLNVHDKFTFHIYPPIPGYSVRCVFSDDLYDEVHAALRQTVTVYGTLHFRPDRPFPEWVKVKSIEVHPPDRELPKLSDLRGSWKGATGEMDAASFIRAQRDE